MAPAFSKEAILQGSIDHLCLVCESHLRSEQDVCRHVATAEHRQNLDSTDYVEKYRNDRVRKVKKWYYCEFCNILASTITKVRLHVDEFGHKENAASQTMTRVGDFICFGNIAVTDDAWNGFIDEDTCTICNIEFDDKVGHRNESSHIINLIQNQISHDVNNIYRKIDDSTFHCLTCNTVVAGIMAHLDETQHKDFLQRAIKNNSDIKEASTSSAGRRKCSSSPLNENGVVGNKNNVSKNNDIDHSEIAKISSKIIPSEGKAPVKTGQITTQTNKNNSTTSDQVCKDPQINKKDTSSILDSIAIYQNETVNINFESCTAVCRKCAVNLEFDHKAIDNHIEGHNIEVKNEVNGTTSVSHEKDENNKAKDSETLSTSLDKQNNVTKATQNSEVIQKMAEKYDMTYSSNKLFCKTCNKHIPISVKNINEHVNGELHKNNARAFNKGLHSKDIEIKKVNARKHLERVPTIQFLKTVSMVGISFMNDLILNDNLCVNHLSFIFLRMSSPGLLRCLLCEVSIPFTDINVHLLDERHLRALKEIPVVIHNDSEFIREVRSELFQCGHCNVLETWETLENHFKTSSHKDSKTAANWRLSQHLSQIQQLNVPRTLESDFFSRLLIP